MRFTVNKQEFEKAIVPVSIIAQSKAADSTLSGVYMEAVGTQIVLYCYDIEKGIKTTVDATVEQEGCVIADVQIVPIIHSMPDGDIVFTVGENHMLTLSSGDAVFEVMGRDGTTYPKIPEIKGHTAFTISKKQFKSILVKTMFSLCKDDTKPILKGSLFKIKDNTLSVCAMDSFRFAVRKEKSATDNPDVDLTFILPGKAQQNILRLLNDGDDDIHMELGNKHIILNEDNLYLVIRLLDGEFPDYEKFLPPCRATAVIDRDALIGSLERVAIVNEKMRSSAKLHFENDELKLSCETDSGKTSDRIPVHMEGEATDVLFNQVFLLDALRACDNEKVLLRLAEGGKGTVITFPEDAGNEDSFYLYLVMPIRSR